MKKGEVWYGNFPPPIGKRPIVILSRDEACTVRNSVTVAEITTRILNIAVDVPIGPEDGLPKQCVANLDTIATVNKRFLTDRISFLSSKKMEEIHKAIKFALDL
ncbi:MAG: type II toxin-antitoxin system PemK/MazF family toxin [Elusimicrobiota bacterium]|nr:type II toxin-antitoxin system PemK/MazF family toxin [Elusimicrobiota bacterium]